jgi:valyl-tRNA synthetase
MIRPMDNSGDILRENILYIEKLARAREIEISSDLQAPGQSASDVRSSMEIFVPLKGLIDIDAELERLGKEGKKAEKEVVFFEKKLMNKNFVDKAPEAVVEETRVKFNEYKDKIKAIQGNIEKLKQLG